MQIAKELNEKAAVSLGILSKYRKWEPTIDELEELQKNPHRRQIIKNTTIGWYMYFNLVYKPSIIKVR